MSAPSPLRSALPCLAARAGAPPSRRRPVEDGHAYFPQAVASGEPEAHDVVLWTRAVDPRHPTKGLQLTLQVARDARFEQCVLEAPGLRTSCVQDHTLKVRVTHLEPSTRYHYRFLVERDGRCLGSTVGRTRTGPESALERPLHFVVARIEELSGAEGGGGWRTHDGEPDFILVLGEDLCRLGRARPEPRPLIAAFPLLVLWEDGAPPARRSDTRRALCAYLPVDVPAEAAGAGSWTQTGTGRGPRASAALVTSPA